MPHDSGEAEQAADAASTADRNLWKRTKFIIGVVLIVLLIVTAAYHEEVLGFFDANKSIMAQLVGAFVAGLVASAILWLYDNHLRDRERDQVALTVGSLGQRYNDLLNRLFTVGGNITKGVLEYHPETSKSIAQVLSDELNTRYARNFRKVAVSWAQDTYKIVGLQTAQIGPSRFPIWEMLFHSSWTWKNDSDTTKRPLKDLMIVLSAPDEAVGSFIRDMDAAEQSSEVQRFHDFMLNKNIVRAWVINPQKISERVSESELESLFPLGEVRIRLSILQQTLSLRDLERITVGLPRGVYAAFRLPREHAGVNLREYALRKDPRQELADGLRVDFWGKMTLPADGNAYGRGAVPVLDAPMGNGEADAISYPPDYGGQILHHPSDIILGKYSLYFIHPTQCNLGPDRWNVVIRKDESGRERPRKGFDHRPREIDVDDQTQSAAPIPLWTSADAGVRKVQLIEFEEPLTEYESVSLSWTCRPV